MGNGGAKQTNQMLNEQRGLGNTNAADLNARGANEYDYRTGLRGDITNKLWDAYGSAPTTTGGRGAGWNNGMYQDIYGRYQGLADNGGWSDEDKQGYRSWTTAPIAGFYSGMKNNLQRANNALGGYAGYNSQAASLGRDAARQGAQTALESESSLQDKIRAAKLQGLQGMSSTLGQGYHNATAGSAGGPGTQSYYLNQLQGLMGGAEDLQYSQLGQQGLNQGYTGITNRRDETPLWQKSLASIVPSAAGAAIGAFGGGGGKRQVANNNNNGYGPE